MGEKTQTSNSGNVCNNMGRCMDPCLMSYIQKMFDNH